MQKASVDQRTIASAEDSLVALYDGKGELVDLCEVKGIVLDLAVSNNRWALAVVLDATIPWISIYTKKLHEWECVYMSPVSFRDGEMQWQEPEDSRYPPHALLVQLGEKFMRFEPGAKRWIVTRNV